MSILSAASWAHPRHERVFPRGARTVLGPDPVSPTLAIALPRCGRTADSRQALGVASAYDPVVSEDSDHPNSRLPRAATRTLALLELLSAGRPLPASTLVARCEIPRSSAYELLAGLADAGYVARSGQSWSLGPRARALGAGETRGDDLVSVLDAFHADHPEALPAELAARADLDLARTERATAELVRLHLLEPAPRGRVRLGLRLAALAARITPLERLRAAALPHLARLRDETGETASLLVEDGARAVYLEQAESRHAMRHTGWTGRDIPLSDTAGGLALRHPGTCQVVEDAVEVGVIAVARAIPATSPRAAISVIGPTARIGGSRLPSVRASVGRATRAVERSLSAIPVEDPT